MTYNCACNNDCLCFPCCCFPCFMTPCNLCGCAVERERDGSHTWVTRDKHGRRTGAIMIVDHEKGTIAHYGTKCCSTELDDTPACYCEKV